jgi:hypothetical protein
MSNCIYVQSKDSKSLVAKLQVYYIHHSQSTETAAHVFLSDDSKAILHDSPRRIWRKAQLVKTCVRCGQVIITFAGFANE